MHSMSDVKVPMRDGIRLSANVYRPDDGKPYPAILLRTPYLKEKIHNEWLYANYAELAATGYNVVFQDVRGTGMSEGVLLSSGGNEVDDGYDTVEWIAAQSWCDGHVGMFGLSYFGYAQLAAAEHNPPHLDTVCPFQNAALYPLSINKPGTFGHYHLMWLYQRVLDSLDRESLSEAEKVRIRGQVKHNIAHWDSLVGYLPVRENPAAHIEGVPLLHDFVNMVDGVEDPAYWEQAHRPIHLQGIDMPMLFLTGWFDGARDGTFDNFNEIMANGTETARKNSRIIVGPWVHGGGLATQLDGMDFGEENSGAGRGIRELMRSWFDRWLKNIPEKKAYAPVTVFVLGQNIWREEETWPPPRAIVSPWYLHDGKLSQVSADRETTATYIYDPDKPLPSSLRDKEGRTLFADPSCLDTREDVLVYSSNPLDADLEICGCVTLRLFAATDAVDTDFHARLCDVDGDGYAFPLLDGIVRGKFRNGRTPELLTPGKVYEYTIELGNICNVFKAGHRLKLTISSSSFPAHDRNLNTGERTGWGAKGVPATQTIFHGKDHPSSLMLPVLPI